jgi:hypothetical protein
MATTLMSPEMPYPSVSPTTLIIGPAQAVCLSCLGSLLRMFLSEVAALAVWSCLCSRY